MLKKLTIGKLAKAADVTVETIRYYQNIGLLVEPMKPFDGFREYPQDYIKRVKFVKQAQKLNFSLEEIQGLLKLGSGHCEDVLKMAIRKRKLIQTKIDDLNSLADILDTFIKKCEHHDPKDAHCALIDALLDFD
jgi:MerR family transcriptional regulator, mercuric resistance operon regulatory protein